MRVLICDDERLARERLARLLGDMEGIELVGEAANGLECLAQVQERHPDVVLLDLRMPVMDGLAAAEQLSRLSYPPAIIFCTAYEEHALEAFQVQAVGYLLKPILKDQLVEALARASGLNQAQLRRLDKKQALERRRHISARTHRGVELIPIEDVRYFLADQKYVTVRHSNGEVLIDETLKDLENEFAGMFIRIHRNALISLSYLEGLELAAPGQYQARLKGIDERLTISRRHLADVKGTFQKI